MDAIISGDWIRIAYVLGAVQGVFLAAVLAGRRRNSVPNKLLAATMLVFSLDLAVGVYHAAGYYRLFPAFIGVDYPLTFLYGPLVYLYALTLSSPGQSFGKGYLLHFLPFALAALYMLPFYALTGAEKLAWMEGPGGDTRTTVLAAVNHLKLVHAVVYVSLTVLLLKRHRSRIRETFSSIDRITLRWLSNLTVALIAITVIVVILHVLSAQGTPSAVGMDGASPYDDFTLLTVTVFVYLIGYMGLRQPEIFVPRERTHLVEDVSQRTTEGDGALATSPAIDVRESQIAGEAGPGKPRYTRSGMDAETARLHLDALRHVMDTQRPYRKSDLTLPDLADAVAISPHNLTEVINTQLGQNFYDFVNGYRIREVQERLEDTTTANLTLLAIGMDAGFNSKSSFNAAFKKHTGMTPSEYRKAVEATQPAL